MGRLNTAALSLKQKGEDYDSDGRTTVWDAALLGQKSVSGGYNALYDVNSDEHINLKDTLHILKSVNI